MNIYIYAFPPRNKVIFAILTMTCLELACLTELTSPGFLLKRAISLFLLTLSQFLSAGGRARGSGRGGRARREEAG